ncbi:ureidoglycolate lyase, partial [Rhizobium ruizarguesonis]
MTELLDVRPLTRSFFAPFGEVIEADPASLRLINGGTTDRFHALAATEATGSGRDYHGPRSGRAASASLPSC